MYGLSPRYAFLMERGEATTKLEGRIPPAGRSRRRGERGGRARRGVLGVLRERRRGGAGLARHGLFEPIAGGFAPQSFGLVLDSWNLSLDCCYLAGLLLFIGPAATMITTDSPPGSPKDLTAEAAKEMAFKRDFRISQFQRELKLQERGRCRRLLRRPVAAPASDKEKWDVVLERRRRNTPKRLCGSPSRGRKAFDADATLHFGGRLERRRGRQGESSAND